MNLFLYLHLVLFTASIMMILFFVCIGRREDLSDQELDDAHGSNFCKNTL